MPLPLPRSFAALAMVLAAGAQAPALAAQWDFTVLLDGAPIGSHRFVIDGTRERAVESTALYEVKMLGWVAYRYQHRASERWQGDCLASIAARTDDNGTVTEVGRSFDPASCAMSFAYWNPAIAQQRRLLDPGTGKMQDVQVTRLPPTTLTVRGRSVPARGLRIAGPPQPIDVWYEGDAWVGLDATVRGNRRLSYRLQ